MSLQSVQNVNKPIWDRIGYSRSNRCRVWVSVIKKCVSFGLSADWSCGNITVLIKLPFLELGFGYDYDHNLFVTEMDIAESNLISELMTCPHCGETCETED